MVTDDGTDTFKGQTVNEILDSVAWWHGTATPSPNDIPQGGYFYGETNGIIYEQTNATKATPTWTKRSYTIIGTPTTNDFPLFDGSKFVPTAKSKRRATTTASFWMDGAINPSSGTRFYMVPFGHSHWDAGNQPLSSTESNVSMPLSAEAITVRRVRIFVFSDGVGGGDTYDVGMRNETDNSYIYQDDGNTAGASVKIDSGDLSISVDGGDSLTFYWEPTGTTGTDAHVLYIAEYEYDGW